MRKMQFKKGKIEKKYLVVLAAFVAAAVLLGTAAGILVGRGGGNLPAWLTVIVIILLVALPLLVLALLFAVAGKSAPSLPQHRAATRRKTAGLRRRAAGLRRKAKRRSLYPQKGRKRGSTD